MNIKTKRKTSTVVKICCSGLLGMTLLLAVLAFKSDLNYYLTETTYDALAEISDDHEYFFQTHLDGAFNTLQAVALSYPEEERYGMEHFFGYVQRVVDTTDFQYFGVVEEDGTFTTNTGYQGSIYGQPLFEEVMRGERAISQPIGYGENEEEHAVILMAYPIVQNEAVRGAILGIYEFSGLNTILRSNLWDGEGYSTVIDKEGNVVLSDDNVNRLYRDGNAYDFYSEVTFMDGFSLEQMKEGIQNGESAFFTYQYNGHYRIAYYTLTEINDWVIITTIPDLVVQNKAAYITKITNKLILMIFFIFLILLLWVWGKGREEKHYFKELASKDSMTGLLNKATTERRIRSLLQREPEEEHALFMLDIDNFKGINDTMGHQAGDETIMKTAALLRGVFSMNDIAGRIGGDEFVVLCRKPKNQRQVEEKAKEILLSFETIGKSLKRPISCSIGIVFFTGEINDYQKLFEAADEALYQSKQNGKGQYTFGNSMKQ